MAGFTGKFDSVRQDWETPQSLFDEVNAEFGFTLDAAASSLNTKVKSNYLDAARNALSLDWGTNIVWLNPPYGAKSGSLQEWVRKAWDASTKGATVVMLIPARTNTNWFHDYALGKGEVRFVRGRPRFGDATHGLPQPLCYVIFRPTPSQGLDAATVERATSERKRIALAIVNQVRNDYNLPPCTLDDVEDPSVYLRQADAIIATEPHQHGGKGA